MSNKRFDISQRILQPAFILVQRHRTARCFFFFFFFFFPGTRAVSARSRRSSEPRRNLRSFSFPRLRTRSLAKLAFSKEGRKVRFKASVDADKNVNVSPASQSTRASSYLVAHCRDREKSRDNNADVPAKIARASSRFGNA